MHSVRRCPIQSPSWRSLSRRADPQTAALRALPGKGERIDHDQEHDDRQNADEPEGQGAGAESGGRGSLPPPLPRRRRPPPHPHPIFTDAAALAQE